MHETLENNSGVTVRKLFSSVTGPATNFVVGYGLSIGSLKSKVIGSNPSSITSSCTT